MCGQEAHRVGGRGKTLGGAAAGVAAGADGVIVSNHGGRAEDSGRATLECLPEVVEAIAGRNRDELILCTKAGYRIGGPGHSLDPDFLEDGSLVHRRCAFRA